VGTANRINARLDDELARKVELVRKRTNRTVSQIVQESLLRYCEQELADGNDSASILKATRFVGCADGPADLSSTYKTDLVQSLRRKT
jgi:predicted DNA-binding protein